MMKRHFLILLFTGLYLGQSYAKTILVTDNASLNTSLSAAIAGDTIKMKSGTWKDVAVIFQAAGTREQPVVLTAEKSGAVIISGQSQLKIGGQYLEVYGLTFANGYTPAEAVIEFRTDNEHLANHCRVSNCLITNYSQPRRFDNDNWVLLWGKNNRVDHCTFEDKLNTGPTLVVNLNDERSQQNHHSVDNNYFKGRQRFGSNGGETMRIGVSRYSLTASHTKVADNFFERCNGEVEIISVKSGANILSNNFFYECEGGLVLRHGDNNLVENNVFIGNNKPFTGGIRIINSGHTVRNNVMIGLAGDRFRSAMTIMNGVPNSLINRYFQVSNTSITRNSFIDCKQILLGGGKDAERTLGPVSSSFQQNLVVASKGKTRILDDNHDGGLSFTGNESYGAVVFDNIATFKNATLKNKTWHGMDMPSATGTGADLSAIKWIDKNHCGVDYPYHQKVPGRKPKALLVDEQNKDALPAMVATLQDGDTLKFATSGSYGIVSPIIINKQVVIQGKKENDKQTGLYCNGEKNIPALIVIENGGSLCVKDISFNGAEGSYGEAAAGITTTAKAMNKHYNLIAESCRFYHFNESGYSGIKGGKGTFADTVIIKDCAFRNISGTAVNFSEEKDDKGIYNVDNLYISNCSFSQILNAAVNVYRGGNDESTTGPFVQISNCLFNEVDNKEQGVVVKLIGVQEGSLTHNIFNKSGQGGRSIWFEEFRWDNLVIKDNKFYQSGRKQTFYDKDYGSNETFTQSYDNIDTGKL